MSPSYASFDPHAVPAGTVARVHKVFATAPDGSQAGYPLIVIAGSRPGPTCAFVAGIHGDEYEGPRALQELVASLRPEALAGRLIIVPVAHLAAFAAGSRASPIDGANLARIFPGDAAGTVTQRLARDLFDTVVRRADFLVDLHSGGVAYAFVQVAGWYGADTRVNEKAAAASLELAKDLNLPWLWKLPPRAGVLSYEAAAAGIPATGAEAGGRGGCLDEDWQAYLAGLRRILVRRGMIEAGDLPPARSHAAFLGGDDLLPAPAGGLLDSVAPLGGRVEKGALLARILSPEGEEIDRLIAPHDGVVMATRHLRTVRAGEGAASVLRELPL